MVRAQYVYICFHLPQPTIPRSSQLKDDCGSTDWLGLRAIRHVRPRQLVVNAGLLVVMARYLEPIWGSTELLRFVLVVNAAVGVLAFCWMMLVFMMTGSEEYLYGRANGFHGVIAAFLVAIKQLLPEHEVRLLAVTRIKLKVRARRRRPR